MELLRRQLFQKSLSICKYLQPISNTLPQSVNGTFGKALFHTTQVASMANNPPQGPKKWPTYNKKVFPPQLPGEERRPAYVCHMRTNIKYSPFKMWYVASMIRGMTIDEALKQLSFVNKKGAVHVKETLLEAQKLAVETHNVEYKSNLWVAESFASKGLVVKGIRRHAKARIGIVSYFHCHYFVRLEEGTPPKHYFFESAPKTTATLLTEWVDEMRRKKIPSSL